MNTAAQHASGAVLAVPSMNQSSKSFTTAAQHTSGAVLAVPSRSLFGNLGTLRCSRHSGAPLTFMALPLLRHHYGSLPGSAQGWINDSRGGGTRPWRPSRKRVPKCLKWPKTTYTTFAIAKKQSKRTKKGPFCYVLGPPGPTQEMELMGPGGEGPSRSSQFLQPWFGRNPAAVISVPFGLVRLRPGL